MGVFILTAIWAFTGSDRLYDLGLGLLLVTVFGVDIINGIRKDFNLKEFWTWIRKPWDYRYEDWHVRKEPERTPDVPEVVDLPTLEAARATLRAHMKETGSILDEYDSYSRWWHIFNPGAHKELMTRMDESRERMQLYDRYYRTLHNRFLDQVNHELARLEEPQTVRTSDH